MAMALLLFVPAGTAQYCQAWIYLAVFFGASGLITLYLIRKDPALLERRLHGGPTAEKKKTQKIIMLFVLIGFIALLVIPGFDYRFGWSRVPLYIVIAGNFLTALGLYITFLAYKANTFAFATVQVTPNQKVISTGPICSPASPHVRRRVPLSLRHPPTGTRLVLGADPAHSHDSFSNMATF
jgi:protein-S-isoprenylcysteine O-methyltransferase Ste14